MAHQANYEVLFYEVGDGHCPADEFLDTLEKKVRAKVFKWIDQLAIYGPDLPRPYADVLRDKIRKLRVRFGSDHFRFLYFFMGKHIIITHGFVKKTDLVPDQEIDKAIGRMNDFLRRWKQGEIVL